MKPLNIFVAVDDTEASLHACRLVAAYRSDRSTFRIILLNVQRPPLRLAPGSGVDHATLETGAHELGGLALEPGRALLLASGKTPELVVSIGPPAGTILDVAQRYENCVLDGQRQTRPAGRLWDGIGGLACRYGRPLRRGAGAARRSAVYQAITGTKSLRDQVAEYVEAVAAFSGDAPARLVRSSS